MQVIIVGGSIAGLMIARVLRECGIHVKIIEKSNRLCSPAGISLGRNAVELLERFTPHSMPQTIENTGIVHFDAHGNIAKTERLPDAAKGIRTSSWNEVYQCLRKGIEVEGRHWITGSVVVADGTRVTEVIKEGESLSVKYENQRGLCGQEYADIVVAADGAYSFVGQLNSGQMPSMGSPAHVNVRLPQYSKYVAWRKSMCYEDNLPHRNLRAILEGNLGFYTMPDACSYFILYAVPGHDQSESPRRRIEWCWYQYCKDPSVYLNDKQAMSRHSTFTPDLVDYSAWQSNVKAFEDKIPSWIKDSMQQGPLPMLSKVTTRDGTQSLYLDKKVLCIGDAFQQITPHLGLASDLAAYQALELHKFMSGQSDSGKWDLLAWERSSLIYGGNAAGASMMEGANRMRGTREE